MDLLDFRILASLRDSLSARHFLHCTPAVERKLLFLTGRRREESPAQSPSSSKGKISYVAFQNPSGFS